MISLQPISNVVGVLLVVIGSMMLATIPVSLWYESGDAGTMFESGAITCIVGILIWKLRFSNKAENLNKREGYLIVALSWLAMGFFSSLPYYFSGFVDSPVDAIFESFSGLTTTGATIFSDIEILPKGILFWRSLTQWIGGMGIIVLTIALFPLLGIAGIELFVAESPGPRTDKLHPRIKETAKRLWLLYVGLTALLALILMLEGMSQFDAVNHALTTMATGGFSTKNASVAAFNSPIIEYTLVLFMFIAGMNYFVIYNSMLGRFKLVWKNEEFRYYLLLIAGLSIFLSIGIFVHGQAPTFEQAFRDTIFQVVSVVTTTGFVTADYTQYSNAITGIFFVLLFLGASAGSTSGGIKLVRHIVFVKNSALEFKRILHPRAMIRIKLNKEIVAPRILTHILVFLLVYLACFIVSTLILTTFDNDLLTAAGAAATSLGNVGPGIGDVGPVSNFSMLTDASKLLLSFLMIVGRLELFTILILFTPYFWKIN